MTMFIRPEYLVGNALISLYEETGIDKINTKILNDYQQALTKQLIENNINFVFLESKEMTLEFINNSKHFKISELDNGIEFSIKENVTIDILRKKYRSPLQYELLKCIISIPVLKTLGIEKENKKLQSNNYIKKLIKEKK